jgi:glutamate/tyrosine decarboxylase-like PLP-dependent enzyme
MAINRTPDEQYTDECTSTIEEYCSALDPPDWNELRKLGHDMVDDMLSHLRTVRDRPVWQPMPENVQGRFARPLPTEGQDPPAVYREFRESILPYALGNTHPRFWGWVIGTGTPVGMLAELLAAGMNSNCTGGNQGATWVELQVLDWAKEMLGFPADASGVLVSGGSMANLVALAVARTAGAGFDVGTAGLQGAPRRLVLYASSETHVSIRKAVTLLGLGSDSLRSIPVTPSFDIDLTALTDAIATDRANAHKPLCVVANAGTVNTGAIDPLERLADLCRSEGLWLHVDAAIGGPAAVSPQLAPALAGIERADSVIFDFHKWLYMPYGVGCVLVRDAKAHRETFAAPADYLARNPRGLRSRGPGFADYGPELSRPFHALKLWMSLKVHGTARYAACLERNVAQARHLARLVAESRELELLAPVSLNIVCFRFVGPGLPDATLDLVNREILMDLEESGVAVLSQTSIHGRLALRVAITNHRTAFEDLDLLVCEVVARGRRLAVGGDAADPARQRRPRRLTPARRQR